MQNPINAIDRARMKNNKGQNHTGGLNETQLSSMGEHFFNIFFTVFCVFALKNVAQMRIFMFKDVSFVFGHVRISAK